MKLPVLCKQKALTLVELMVSVGLMTFIFSSLAFMVFYTGRNSLIVREQARSQSQAGMAAERITNTLRNASGFRPVTGDMSSTKTEVLFDTPTATGNTRTGLVTFVPASSVNESDGIVRIYDDVATFDAGAPPDWEYPFIQDFKIIFNTPSWITMVVAYSYRGFTLSEYDSDDEDSVHDTRQAGEFISDIIAKNHHPGESAKYADTTTTLFQL